MVGVVPLAEAVAVGATTAEEEEEGVPGAGVSTWVRKVAVQTTLIPHKGLAIVRKRGGWFVSGVLLFS